MPKRAVAAPGATESAEIDRIMKARKKGAELLVAWADGAPPQWLPRSDLEGTAALEEWDDAEDDVPEEFDPPPVVAAKVAQLVGWLREAKRPAFLVGAGLSAPVLPTFRGKGGLWTKSALSAGAAGAPARGAPPPAPTLGHRALVALAGAGRVNFLASQNYDNLLRRAGFPAARLAELHGNNFIESCERCLASYTRDFEVAAPDAPMHHRTGRKCERAGCGGALLDNIVHFSEALPWGALTMANAKFVGAGAPP
jgi:mono-ADP-ribosyltransferase sirtuin 6